MLRSDGAVLTLFFSLLFPIRSASSAEEYLFSSSKIRGELFRKIFNFTVQGDQYCLFISIIRTGDKVHLKCVWACYCWANCLSKYFKIRPEAEFTFVQLPLGWGFLGGQRSWRAATAGSCALYSLGCNKNFTIFHKGAISDLTNKWAKAPTGVKFYINICMREQNHTSII